MVAGSSIEKLLDSMNDRTTSDYIVVYLRLDKSFCAHFEIFLCNVCIFPNNELFQTQATQTSCLQAPCIELLTEKQ